ncbi:hypothetical protein RHGRI_011415 [Rhododendron griersonianum]|uniref:Uncharacterized protein n=1 Tax=Rhododendron griersonianum TaxID=479676 RepID=A0AAV6KMY9_9ERIC|nr:hypothetical protein RHGRI_011415 [Rhododendron griersonianum]
MDGIICVKGDVLLTTSSLSWPWNLTSICRCEGCCRDVEEVCAENITKFISDKSRQRNQSSLSELFISFLAKVEDPFEQPANSARTVSSRQLGRISEVFRTTHHVLISGNQNQHSLIATLVTPQVSQLFARMPANPSGYNSGYIATPRPQMHSPMQAQY